MIAGNDYTIWKWKMMSKDKVRKIWGESAQKALNMITNKPSDPKDALDQVYQYLEEFKHLSERLEMVADNCKQPHNKDSCRAIATLITTNAKIVDEKLKKYLSIIVEDRVENKTKEMLDKITKNSKYVDPLPESMPIQLEGQITDLTKKNKPL